MRDRRRRVAIARFSVAHTAPGPANLITAPHRHQIDGSRSNAATGPVAAALLEAGLTVFVIPSRQVTAPRTRYSVTGNKDERFDAYPLADVLRTDPRRLTPLTTDTEATVGLPMLVRARADLPKGRVAAHYQLRTHLQLVHPDVVGLFHELDGEVSLAFLTHFPTRRHVRWLSEKRLAAWPCWPSSRGWPARCPPRSTPHARAHPKQQISAHLGDALVQAMRHRAVTGGDRP